MSKNERRRTMVYSNVNKKKADSKSASSNDNIIDLDDEVVIGLASFPKPDNINIKKKNKNDKKSNIEQKNNDKSKKSNIDKTNKQVTKFNKELNIKQTKEKQNKSSSKDIYTSQIDTKKSNDYQIGIQEKIKRQKIRAIRKMSIIVLLIILIIGGTIYLFLSPVFNIKTIDVINNNYISSQQIINVSGITINENMFKFSKKEAKNNILSNPYIESVQISRNVFSDKVEINVKERVATLMLEYGNSYVYINNQGYILEISTKKINSPILKGYVTPLEDVKPGKRLNKDDLERLETVLSIIEMANSNELGELITQIDIKNKDDYIIVLESEDKTVYLGNCSDLSTQMLYVKEMLEREKGIEGEFFVDMDLNTGNPVFREKV